MVSLFSKGELAPLIQGDNLDVSTASDAPGARYQQRHSMPARAGSAEYDPLSMSNGRRSAGNVQIDSDLLEVSERSQMLRSLYIQRHPSRALRPESAKWNARAVRPPNESTSVINFGNIAYSVLCGWWLAVGYLILALLCFVSIAGIAHGKHCVRMSRYVLFPFGLYLSRESAEIFRPTVVSRIGFGVWAVGASFVGLLHVLASVILWLLVYFIPASKVSLACATLLFDDPLQISVKEGSTLVGGKVILAVYDAAKLYYFRYRVGGINVVFFNLLLLAPTTIGVAYGLGEHFRVTNAPLVMVFSLLAIIPLANLIGVAISSISSRISFAFGAVLNATFGSTIEIFIFLFSLRHVDPSAMFVQKALMGSILADLLLMSSLSIVAGGLKHKEQKFNRQAAGVSSVLMIVAIVGVFTPTLMYKLHGNPSIKIAPEDPIYNEYVWPLALLMAAILPFIYVIGLVFTLKTHAYLVAKRQDLDEEAGEGVGEEVPEWSIKRSVATLTVCTGMVAALAECLSEVLSEALHEIGIAPAFAGLTVIAWVPALCEYINAVVFALEDNVSLSLSIATSSALQVSMIQLPALVWMQMLLPLTGFWEREVFWPLFSTVDMIVLLMAVLMNNYLSSDGRSNYLEGAAMLTVYVLALAINYCAADYQLNHP